MAKETVWVNWILYWMLKRILKFRDPDQLKLWLIDRLVRNIDWQEIDREFLDDGGGD